MPRFRLTVRKTEVSHEVIEVVAKSASGAAEKGDRYVDGHRRGVQVVQPYDNDRNATELTEVIAVREF